MAENAASAKGQLTVLVVDDEQIVLNSAQKLLRKEPFELITALGAAEGLSLLEGGGIQVVLTDLKMPSPS
jgi:CheY-like chemotaxis protein